MKLGRFICVEGIEGTGKTTHMHFIKRYLTQRLAESPVMTREPGGTPLAEAIRSMLLQTNTYQEPLAPEAELLLLFAARRQHIINVIEPALHRNQWVICDRFTETSFAYQGYGRGIAQNFIQTLQLHVHQSLKIDRVILLDMPAPQALNRLKQKHSMLDRIEQEPLAFFERARAGYLKRAIALPTMYRIVDADQSIKRVEFQLAKILDELLSYDTLT